MSLKKRLRPRLLAVYALAVAFVVFATPTLETLPLGVTMVLLGEGLRVWATGHLIKTDALTISGPYAYLRHPLYVGTLSIAAGFACMGHNPVILGLFGLFVVGYFAYYMPYKNRIESARLESLYGDAFRRYAVAVPALVPRIYAYTPLPADRTVSGGWERERFAENNEVGTALVVALGVFAMLLRWSLS